MRLADVAVPVPLGRAFTYRVPDRLAAGVVPGARVLCRFGPRQLAAVVLEVSDREPAFDPSKLRDVDAVIDAEPVLPAELLAFARELAAYYFAPVGEALRLALPAVERSRSRALASEGVLATDKLATVGGRLVTWASAAPSPPDGAVVPRGAPAAVLALLREGGPTRVAELVARWPNARAVVRRLEAAGLARTETREEATGPLFGASVARDVPPEPTEAQAEAVATIEAALASRAPRAFLLHGVTGSGKTEVYLRAIAACRAGGRGALVLVPEIALTPQLVSRFRARFGDDVAVLHSGLAERERHAMWTRLRTGAVNVAIGARSALFAPVPDLGLVVVDEEHDGSFKQEEGTRYHARDMAMLRAHRAGAVCVLGSATPSLETEALAPRGRVTRLTLPVRAHAAATLPEVRVVDVRKFRGGPSGDRFLSAPLHAALATTLAAGEQAILFLNRRGFAPSVVCDGCGEIVSCADCSVALTFHRARGGRLRCHYCDHDGPMPDTCPSCGAAALVLEGLGTEKLEDAIARAFPSARVARLDRDVASGAGAERILERVRRGEVDVLVGTQMVTKGHDLPRVTLVGVVNADAALSVPDFRAGERAFQLLVQVAGRAGRSDLPGVVVVQTRNPDSPSVRFAARHEHDAFVAHELAAREELAYPPFAHLALVRLDAEDEATLARAGEALAAELKRAAPAASGEVDVLGPAAAPIARLRGRYRTRIQLKAEDRRPLRAVLAIAVRAIARLDRSVRAMVDVDPVQMM